MQRNPGEHWFQRGDSSRNDAAVVAAEKQLGNRGVFHLHPKDSACARHRKFNGPPPARISARGSNLRRPLLFLAFVTLDLHGRRTNWIAKPT